MGSRMKTTSQFLVGCSPEVRAALEAQHAKLGFNTANSLAAVYVNALSGLPPEKVWEALATIQKMREKASKPPISRE